MKLLRRLLFLASGLLILCSCNYPWFNDTLPTKINLGDLIQQSISILLPALSLPSLSVLDSISMMLALFIVGVIIIASSSMGSKILSIVGIVLSVILVLAWALTSKVPLANLVTDFANIGLGTQLACLGIICALIGFVLPKLLKIIKKPAPVPNK